MDHKTRKLSAKPSALQLIWKKMKGRLPRSAKEDLESQNDGPSKIPHELNNKVKSEHGKKNPIIFSSYDLFLLSNQKQVCFERNCFAHASPMKSMNLVWYDSYPIYLEKNECIIQVELSTVSYFDCALRKNECYDKMPEKPDVPGFCAIGRVIALPHCNENMEDVPSFHIGDRVATMLFKGGNARYVTQSTSRLIKISDEDNGKQMCALLCASMAAFACLQHFTPESKRYDTKSHCGESVFINGGMCIVGQAAIQLCYMLGASKVFATGSPKDFKFIEKIGAIPLPIDLPMKNPEIVKQIDTIVDCTSFDDLKYLQSIRKDNGHIIYYEHGDVSESGRHGWRSDLHRFFLKCKLVPYYRSTSFCDPFQEIFLDNFDRFKSDFKFIKGLMKVGHENPLCLRIQSTIPLDKVPYTQLKIEKYSERGVTIVDPWK